MILLFYPIRFLWETKGHIWFNISTKLTLCVNGFKIFTLPAGKNSSSRLICGRDMPCFSFYAMYTYVFFYLFIAADFLPIFVLFVQFRQLMHFVCRMVRHFFFGMHPPLRLLHSRFQRFAHQLYLPIFLLQFSFAVRLYFLFLRQEAAFSGAMLSKSTKDILYLFSVSTSRSHSTNSRQSFPVYCRHLIHRVFPTEVVLPSIYKT